MMLLIMCYELLGCVIPFCRKESQTIFRDRGRRSHSGGVENL